MTTKTYNHYIDGKLVATYNEPIAITRKRKTLKQIITSDKYNRRDKQLLKALAK